MHSVSEPVQSFDDVPFLAINQQSLSLGTVLRYLQLSGRLSPLIQDIVSQHIVHQAIQAQDADLPVSVEEVEGAIAQFRQQQRLIPDEAFARWLGAQNLTREVFHKRMILTLKLEQFKAKIAAPDLLAYFQQQQGLLSEADLCCILAVDGTLLETIAPSLRDRTLTMDQVIQTYERREPQQVTVLRGLIPIAQLPEAVRSPVMTVPLGTLIGPILVGQQWTLLQVENRVTAQLTDQVRRELQDRLFQRWLTQQLDQVMVTLGPNLDRQEAIAPLSRLTLPINETAS
ncbi:hypothetical protein [Leptolyngbya sp. CCY15150]|uniref:hypothetical protein n=1 Tax=Leptolyngbya sp. CCY15150 TaxID=2767772 RepID=UPI00194FB661|nr:hypothetical protein [Leptolyngbya sp. CCY15150]